MRTQLKRYEAGAEKERSIREGVLKLVGHNVDIKGSPVLLSVDDFTEQDFLGLFDVKSGEWYVENGWIVGKNYEMNPGMIVSKADFFGDVLLEITAQMIQPSTHDINMMIHGEWTQEGRGYAYVSGLEAFWHGNIGFEKSPEYQLTVATQLLDFKPEAEYKFQLGNVGNKLFVLVNDRLSLEITDPDPIDIDTYGKIGFEAFASWWRFKNLRVYKLKDEKAGEYYNPEF